MKSQSTKKTTVYSILQDAGFDVSEWAKSKGTPASNPKFCYNWAFVQDERIILCLWQRDMKTDDEGIYQGINYRWVNASAFESPTRKRRAGQMDSAIQLAYNKKLEVQVIVLDGPPCIDLAEGESPVTSRCLDQSPWLVESYTDEGDCVLRRGASL
jgi:hypothetical protein